MTVLPEIPYYNNYYYFYYYPGVKTAVERASHRGKRWRGMARKDQQEDKVNLYILTLSNKKVHLNRVWKTNLYSFPYSIHTIVLSES